MNFLSIISKYAPSVAGILILLAVFFVAGAFTSPTQSPPGGNVNTPVNTGSAAQTKVGDLTVNNLIAGNITANTLLKSIGNLIVQGSADISSWANSNVVANLNADKVDSYNVADLLAQSAGGAMFTTWGQATAYIQESGYLPTPSAGEGAPNCSSGWTQAYAGYGPHALYERGTTSVVSAIEVVDICSPSTSVIAGNYNTGYPYGVITVPLSACQGSTTFRTCNTCRVCVK